MITVAKLPQIEGDDRERVVVRALSPLELRQGRVAIGEHAEMLGDEAAQMVRLGAAEILAPLPAQGEDTGSVPGGADPSSAAGTSSPAAEADAADDVSATEATDVASEATDAKPKGKRR